MNDPKAIRRALREEKLKVENEDGIKFVSKQWGGKPSRKKERRTFKKSMNQQISNGKYVGSDDE